jgi:thiol:disulfide interchange protein DsbD
MFASVAWLIWVYSQQVEGGYGTLLGLLGLVFIAFSIWIWGHEPKRQPWKTALHGLSISSIILALLIAFFSHTGADTVSQKDTLNIQESNHHTFSTDLYNQMMAGNDPIFVDMTAAWCITCKYNEKTALLTQTTQALFKEKNIQLLIGDWTNQNPEITKYLSDYGRNGVPLYVYYGPRDSVSGQRPEPKILPQFLTNGIIAEVINSEE